METFDKFIDLLRRSGDLGYESVKKVVLALVSVLEAMDAIDEVLVGKKASDVEKV